MTKAYKANITYTQHDRLNLTQLAPYTRVHE